MNFYVNTKAVWADVFEGDTSHEFATVSDVPLSSEDAKEIQLQLGFDQFNLHSFKCGPMLGRFVSRWHCDVRPPRLTQVERFLTI